MTTREELIEGFRTIIREGLRTTAKFGPDDWSYQVHGEEGGWNRKQIYCHLAATAEVAPGFLASLANMAEGQDAGAGFDIDAFNAQGVSQREQLGPQELMESFKTSYEKLIDFVGQLPEEQLAQRRRFGAVEGPVADIMASVLVLHGLAHIYLASTRAFV